MVTIGRACWLLTVALLGCTSGRQSSALGQDEVQTQSGEIACTIDEAARTPLTVQGGRKLYIEPVALSPSGSEVLLAGWPSYLFARSGGGTPHRVSTESIFGAVITADGGARTVRSPINSRLLSEVRALGRGDGSWDVVFAELIPYAPNRWPPPDTAAHLWHGVYDGSTWRSLDRIPLPPGTTLDPVASSPLIRVGDTLFWAVRTTPGYSRDVLLFRGLGGKWTNETIPTGQAGYVALAHTDKDGLLLATTRADGALRNDKNSLFLYVRDPRWRTLRRVAQGGEQPANSPTAVVLDGRLILTWYADVDDRREVRVLQDAVSAPTEHTVLLDSSYAPLRPVASVSSSSGVYWLVDHVARAASRREVRIFRGTKRGVHEIMRYGSPFVGGFRAVSAGDDILLAGASLEDSLPVSLLVRLRTRCDSDDAG
jgi:hypothetical protein